MIVAAAMFMLVLAHLRTRPGRAWVSIRQSETAALAAGINTTLYKLWAFALASFVTGVAGGLLAGADKYLYSIDFNTQDSITLLAVVLMGGVFSIWGAVVAAILMQFLPALLQNIGVNSDWLIILFGVGVLQVLSTAPAGIVDQMPKDLAKLGRLILRAGRAVTSSGGRAMIEVSDLTVRFGGVTSLDGMSVTFESGTCGLIGPNGAGKTTFFNVLSGFVKPATGSVKAFGEDLLSIVHFRRARWGVRRTFQTEQAIEDLTVYNNVATVHENSGARGPSRAPDVLSAIEFVGLDDPYVKVATLGAGQRRLVEVARAVVGSPRLILLDEPAAGLPDEETEHLSSVIKSIPAHTGALTVLVDHDMSLVSARLRDDGRARFRQAARSRADGRDPPRRARDPRLPRHRGDRDEHDDRRAPVDHPGHRRARRPACRPRFLDRDPGRRGHRPARTQRRRQVEPRARDRGRPAPDERLDHARRSGPWRASALSGSARRASRSSPRAGGC